MKSLKDREKELKKEIMAEIKRIEKSMKNTNCEDWADAGSLSRMLQILKEVQN